MKRLFLIILLFVASFSIASTEKGSFFVKKVYDGDTILLQNGQKVRYLGIDAPEVGRWGRKSEFMALSSKNGNSQLVGRSRVELEFDMEKKDRYGRLLAYVTLQSGEMVNAILLRRGLAHVLAKRPNLKYFSLLLDAQRRAIEENLGIWRRGPERKEKGYVGNSISFRFHRPDCAYAKKIRPSHRILFKKRIDAFWKGFSPGSECRP